MQSQQHSKRNAIHNNNSELHEQAAATPAHKTSTTKRKLKRNQEAPNASQHQTAQAISITNLTDS